MSDPFFNSVSLLLLGDGVDGSSDIIDSSTNNNAISVNGDASLSTSVKKLGSASIHLGSNGGFLAIPYAPHFDYSISDFCLEMYVNAEVIDTTTRVLAVHREPSLSKKGWSLFMPGSEAGKIRFIAGDSNTAGWEVNMTSSAILSTNQHYHVEVDRSGDTFYLFIDGVLQGTDTYTGQISLSADDIVIGINADKTGSQFYGFLDAVRFTPATRNTNNFTPPTLIDLAASEISGLITESLAASTFLIKAHHYQTGEKVGAATTTTNNYTVEISTSDPVYVTITADQGMIWGAAETVSLGDKRFPTDPAANAYYYECTQAGVTDANTEPTWPTTPGNTVTDNNVTWQCVERLVQPITHGPLIPS